MKFNKIEDLRQAVNDLLDRHTWEINRHEFQTESHRIVEEGLKRIARGNCYAPTWAKELLRLYTSEKP